MSKRLFLSFFLLSACQAPVAFSPVGPQLQAQSHHPQASPVGTAKTVFLEVQAQVETLSPEYWLTHLEGQGISADGQNQSGQWVFSFIHTGNGQAIQAIVNAQGMRIKTLPATALPDQEPLEERAWGLDSSRLLAQYGQNQQQHHVELKTHFHRLTWVIHGSQPLFIDAMTGKQVRDTGN